MRVEDIDGSCPTDLQPYADAYLQDMRQRDAEMWTWWGTYGLSAVSIAIERNLAGKKARGKYIKEPVFNDLANVQRTDEQSIQQQREAFVLKMRAMKANWDLNHPKEDKAISEV